MSAGEAREVRAGAQEPLSGLEAVPSRWELLGEVFPLWLPMVLPCCIRLVILAGRVQFRIFLLEPAKVQQRHDVGE